MNRFFVQVAATGFALEREACRGTLPAASIMAADIYSRNKSASNPLPPLARPMKIKDSSKTTRGDNGESFVCFLSLPERPAPSGPGRWTGLLVATGRAPGLANPPARLMIITYYIYAYGILHVDTYNKIQYLGTVLSHVLL